MIENQVIFFVTKHKKEQIVAPSFLVGFQANVIALDWDTDSLGTFSGEKERVLDPLPNARKKIELAIESGANGRFYLASEGSFVPHPEIPWLTMNEECLLFFDRKTGMQMHVFQYSEDVFFRKEKLASQDRLIKLLHDFDFPNHGLILKLSKGRELRIQKDFTSVEEVNHLVETMLNDGWGIEMESDLRAHQNPTRQNNIKKAGERLVEELKLNCPSCGSYGQNIKKRIEGVPCANCSIPSQQIKSYLRECYFCSHTWEQDLKNPPIDPQFCFWCNP